MSIRIFRTFSGWPVLAMALVVLLVACVPPASLSPTEPVTSLEPATPTPEVFNPLNPSPTPSASTLPLTCQVTDLNVYVNDMAGYCFAYPEGFALDDSLAPEEIGLLGPALEQTLDPVRVSLGITAQPLPAGSDLSRLVEAYLTQSPFQNLPWSIERSSLSLGGHAAVWLEDVPGRLNSRVVMVLRQNVLLTLRFHPSDVAIAESGLETLFQTVTGSFAFHTEAAHAQLAANLPSVSWNEYAQIVSLSVDPRLAPWVEASTLPAVPVGEGGPYYESHPAYVRFRLLGFQGGRPYSLPLWPDENRIAQVMVYRTEDFPGFGDDTPYGFPGQLRSLTDLLQTGLTPERCAQPLTGYDQELPFLPWLNSLQVFCAQPSRVEFSGGAGLRYLTFYGQGQGPTLDHQVFYTFQGLTHDGRFYISAVLPVATGIFPTEAPASPDPNYLSTLTEQLAQLNGQPEDSFTPSLKALDALVSSLRLEPAADTGNTVSMP